MAEMLFFTANSTKSQACQRACRHVACLAFLLVFSHTKVAFGRGFERPTERRSQPSENVLLTLRGPDSYPAGLYAQSQEPAFLKTYQAKLPLASLVIVAETALVVLLLMQIRRTSRARLSRRRAEEELRENKEWLEMTLEAATAALWELDVRSGKVRWSQKDNSLLGKGPVELELPWEKFLERVPEEDREDLYQRALALLESRAGGDSIVTEWRYHEPGGSERWLLFRGQVYRNEHGKPLRLRGVNVDITVLKQAKSELVELTERLIRAQEDERQRIARELHDDIGQRLSLLIIALDRWQHQLPAELRFQHQELAATLEEANQLATDIHGLSHQLHSSKLKHLGLTAALKELCSQVSRQHGIEVSLKASSMVGELSEERALCLYRVAQEALQNAAKHSGSKNVEVEMATIENILRMKVRDNGCGFDVNHYEAGVGLASMRERLRMAQGKLLVSSRAGEGTEIVTEVTLEPFAKSASAD